LLLLDELEQLVWRPVVYKDELFDAWRELAQDRQMTLAVTTHSTPADLFAGTDFGTRFYELFHSLHLGLLDEAAARDVLAVPTQRVDLAAPPEEIDYFLAQTGPHPFFLQLAGLYLFESLAGGSYSRAEANRRFTAAAEPFWEELWDSLSPLAQLHYPSGAMKSADGMAGRQLRVLANRGLVVSDTAGYRPFSEGFARWVGRIRSAHEAAATPT
jgi:hypothetical protein